MKALGIISFEDSSVNIEGLGDFRPVPATAFMGRYRIIDFILSNMTNSGIDSVQVYCKEKPRNLIEHLGDGRHYNINSKRGKLRILFGEKTFSSPVYNHDIANYILNMQYIEKDKNPYVVIAPSYFIYNIDFSEVLDTHIESGADITALYTNTSDAKTAFHGCDTFTMDKDKRVLSIDKNRGKYKTRSVSLEAYVMRKDLFITLVKTGAEISSLYWFKDVLREVINEVDIRGYAVKGFVACINNQKEYYRINMLLKDYKVAFNLFKSNWPIYTHTNNSSPSLFTKDSDVSASVVANGCEVDGTVKNSIISRNVKIGKDAVIENSIVLPGAVIGDGVHLDHVIVDKYATIHKVKELVGTEDNLIYVKRRDCI